MSYKSHKYIPLKLSFTPTNYPFYCTQIIHHAKQLKAAQQKQNYAHALLSDLQQFVTETEQYQNNRLTPIVRQWLTKVHAQTKDSTLSLNNIITGMKYINTQDNNLIL